MARLQLNKAVLGKTRTALATYRRFLPSLDLKRRQLLAERNRVRARIQDLRRRIETAVGDAGEALPMLADETVDLHHLLAVEHVHLGERNVVGVRLPVVERIETRVHPYGFMTRPHWVDALVERLVEVVRLEIEERVARHQLARLERALTKVTQRVNLFDKVLIPRAEADIRRIRIHLGDAERAAVVTSKIAKAKRAGAAP